MRDGVWGRSKLESFGEDIRGWTKRAESFRGEEKIPGASEKDSLA